MQRVADSTSMVSRSVTFFVSAMNMAIGDGGAWFRTTEHEQTTEEVNLITRGFRSPGGKFV